MSSTTPGGLPALSQKVEFGLLFGVKNKVDMFFAPLIRRAQGSDVFDIREMAGSEGASIKIVGWIKNELVLPAWTRLAMCAMVSWLRVAIWFWDPRELCVPCAEDDDC